MIIWGCGLNPMLSPDVRSGWGLLCVCVASRCTPARLSPGVSAAIHKPLPAPCCELPYAFTIPVIRLASHIRHGSYSQKVRRKWGNPANSPRRAKAPKPQTANHEPICFADHEDVADSCSADRRRAAASSWTPVPSREVLKSDDFVRRRGSNFERPYLGRIAGSEPKSSAARRAAGRSAALRGAPRRGWSTNRCPPMPAR